MHLKSARNFKNSCEGGTDYEITQGSFPKEGESQLTVTAQIIFNLVGEGKLLENISHRDEIPRMLMANKEIVINLPHCLKIAYAVKLSVKHSSCP